MNAKGFTLIELIMVLVLIGIFGAFAAPKMINPVATNAPALVDKLRADIRYAQNLAMTENRPYRVYINTGPAPSDGYAVVNDDSGGAWTSFGYAADPAGSGNLSVTLNNGDYSGITVGTPGYIEFNSLGAPGGSVASVAVYADGAAAGSIVVTSESGAVN